MPTPATTTLDLFNNLTTDELAFAGLKTQRADLAAQLAVLDGKITDADKLDMSDTVAFSADLLANGPVTAVNADGTFTTYTSLDGLTFTVKTSQPINRPIPVPAPTDPSVAPPPA